MIQVKRKKEEAKKGGKKKLPPHNFSLSSQVSSYDTANRSKLDIINQSKMGKMNIRYHHPRENHNRTYHSLGLFFF